MNHAAFATIIVKGNDSGFHTFLLIECLAQHSHNKHRNWEGQMLRIIVSQMQILKEKINVEASSNRKRSFGLVSILCENPFISRFKP